MFDDGYMQASLPPLDSILSTLTKDPDNLLLTSDADYTLQYDFLFPSAVTELFT